MLSELFHGRLRFWFYPFQHLHTVEPFSHLTSFSQLNFRTLFECIRFYHILRTHTISNIHLLISTISLCFMVVNILALHMLLLAQSSDSLQWLHLRSFSRIIALFPHFHSESQRLWSSSLLIIETFHIVDILNNIVVSEAQGITPISK